MSRNYYKHGDYNVICDQCGFKYKGSETAMQWDGLRVCKKCYDPRHPLDFVPARIDKQSVPNPRPEQPDVFLQDNEITLESL